MLCMLKYRVNNSQTYITIYNQIVYQKEAPSVTYLNKGCRVCSDVEIALQGLDNLK